MKKIFIFPALFCILALVAGEQSILMQQIRSKRVADGSTVTAVTGDGGKMITLKGGASHRKFGYLICNVKVAPFTMTGKTLVLAVQSPYAADDQFYVKGLNAAGRVVTSFVTRSNLSCPGEIFCTPGSTAGGVTYFANDVKADPDEAIVTLQFCLGRKGPAADFDMTIRNIRLIDRQEKSGIVITPQTQTGALTLFRVAGKGVPKGTAAVDIADGKISIDAEIKYEKYGYATAAIEVRPFVLAGKSLKFNVKSGNFVANDSFYVKGYDANNKIVFSFYTKKDLQEGLTMICTPGFDGNNATNIPGDVKAPLTNPVVKLVFYCGRPGPAAAVDMEISDIALVNRPVIPGSEGFDTHGVGISSAEVRNVIACVDRNGKRLVITSPIDEGKAYLLLTEVDTGKTFQYYCEGYGGIFGGGVLTPNGKFVFAACGKAWVFDINERTLTACGPAGGSNLCATVAPDGVTAYLGFAPGCDVVEVNTDTCRSRNLGKMDDREQYASYLAVDSNGILYCGIGTARGNIVAFNPRTNERMQILPEDQRKLGTAQVIPGADGYVYALFNDFVAKCLDGKVVELGARCQKARDVVSVKYGSRKYDFPDGSAVTGIDLGTRELVIRENGKNRTIKIEYVSGGLNLTSMGLGPDGCVYFSSSHPNHLGRLDIATGKITDLGFNPRIGGGNWCNMVAFDGKLFGCEYAGGRLWMYDPALPAVYAARKVDHFGIAYGELLANAFSRNGQWRELTQMQVLFGIAGGEDHEMGLKLPVPEKGSWYLNLQFLKSGSYGIITVKVKDQEYKFNLQHHETAPGPMENLGPFDLEGEFLEVRFHASAEGVTGARNYFSLIGIELSENKREIPAVAQKKLNPDILGGWPNLITRPRTIAVNPVTGEVVIAGFANYGLVGGGFGIWDSRSGKTREISDWLPGESCIDMYFRADGNLVGATSVTAPGGGHETATKASVFMIDWPSGKVVKHIAFEGERNIYGVREFGNYIYAAASTGNLYIIDKNSWQPVKTFELSGAPVNRNPLLLTADGKRLFILCNRAVFEVDPADGMPVYVARAPFTISAGGAISGDRIYFISREKIASWQIKDLKR